MKKTSPPELISLKDLYISSYLKAKGFPLNDASLDSQGRTIFHFLGTPEVEEALRGYYMNSASVSPSAFIEAFKALRSLAYTLSGDLKRNKYEMRGKQHGAYQNY